jgi:hypothetical protein
MQLTEEWRAVVSTGMNLRVHRGWGIFLASWVIINFPTRTVLHGVSYEIVSCSHQNKVYDVGFEVITAVSTKMAVFWVVAPCSLVEAYQRFGGSCCLHHRGDERRHLYTHRHENVKSQNVHSYLQAIICFVLSSCTEFMFKFEVLGPVTEILHLTNLGSRISDGKPMWSHVTWESVDLQTSGAKR